MTVLKIFNYIYTRYDSNDNNNYCFSMEYLKKKVTKKERNELIVVTARARSVAAPANLSPCSSSSASEYLSFYSFFKCDNNYNND
jgi:hypothetical protein